MIERKFVAQKMKELKVQEYIVSQIGPGAQSRIEIKQTPLGEKIIVYTTRPGLIVGRRGENINKLTKTLKEKFKMENPQIEIGEIPNPLLDADAVADRIVYTLERFGPKRFKAIGYDSIKKVMGAGALGVEIQIGGRGVPGSRAKSWRFFLGYLKKSGDISDNYVLKAKKVVHLKTGIIGVKVRIMHPDTRLPDKINIVKADEPEMEEVVEEKKEPVVEEKAETKEKEEKVEEKKKVKKAAPKKKTEKKKPAAKKTKTKTKKETAKTKEDKKK